MRCVLVQVHHGRGTTCCKLRLYTRESFVEELTTEPTFHKHKHTPAEAHRIWTTGIEDHYRCNDTQVLSGDLEITTDHRWLVVFDLDTYQPAQLISRNVDLDEYVQTHYLCEFISGDPDELPNRPRPDRPLDWTASQSYCGHIEPRYASEFWGWADGSSDDDPFLSNYTEGYRGAGINIVDLDKWRDAGQPCDLDVAFPPK